MNLMILMAGARCWSPLHRWTVYKS